MRNALHTAVNSPHDPETAFRLYDDAVAEMTVSPSFWRGTAIGLGLLFLGGASVAALIGAVL